jgi:hypothetical protein
VSLIDVGHVLAGSSQDAEPVIYHFDAGGVFIEQLAVPSAYFTRGGASVSEIRWRGNDLYVAINGYGDGLTDFGTHHVLQYSQTGAFVREAVHPNDADPAQNTADGDPWPGDIAVFPRADGSFLIRPAGFPGEFPFLFIYTTAGVFTGRIDLSGLVDHTPTIGGLAQMFLHPDDCTLFFLNLNVPNLIFHRYSICTSSSGPDWPPLPGTDYQAAIPELLPNGNFVVSYSQFLAPGQFGSGWLLLDANGTVLSDNVIEANPPNNAVSLDGARYTDGGTAFWLAHQGSGALGASQLFKIDIATGSRLIETPPLFTPAGRPFATRTLAVRHLIALTRPMLYGTIVG